MIWFEVSLDQTRSLIIGNKTGLFLACKVLEVIGAVQSVWSRQAEQTQTDGKSWCSNLIYMALN